MNGEIIERTGDKLTVKLHSEYTQQFQDQAEYNGRYFVYLEPVIKDKTTDLQRKHYWALIGDIADYTGEPSWKIVLNMKYLYMVTNEKTKEPSMARNKMTRAEGAKLIQTIIDYCLDHDIPLQNNYIDEMTSKQLFKMTMKRICWVCGKHASIHHVEAIGRGYNRKTYQHHEKHTYMALCQQCHQEAHTIGQKQFETKYHIQGIKLSRENLKELNVM